MSKNPDERTEPADNTRPQNEPRQPGDAVTDVLEQASTLRSTLRDALAATGDLIRSLKQDKRRRKAVESTLASLRQLDRSGA